MRLTFLGAAREVTGSCYLLEVGGKNVLIDCGMEQGPNIYENQPLTVKAQNINAVLLTHAHIDHSGKLPLLVKNGFRNTIFLTRASRDLCKIMLMDSAHIQEFEANWRNRKNQRGSGVKKYLPLYDKIDVEQTIKCFRGCDYDATVDVCEGVKAKFIDAGHLLGSSSIEIQATENGITKTIVFSGDIGNRNKPLIRNPQFLTKADYVVMESTYGDRNGSVGVNYEKELAQIIQTTFDKGGNVVIPSFAVGRMQELLYFLRNIKDKNLVDRHPDFDVYLDSPLAVEATKVFNKNLIYCFDKETQELVEKGIDPINFNGLHMSISSDDSKAINVDAKPKVILSASGMCEAGRIRHHLKHNLWRKESSIVFVGYQVEGTLGRLLLDGLKVVKLFNENVIVNANIYQLKGTSSHADRAGLLEWASTYEPKPKKIFVTHGEDSVAQVFAQTLFDEQQQKALAPYNGEVWDLIGNICLQEGNKVRVKSQPQQDKMLAKAMSKNPIYADLIENVKKLDLLIKSNNGLANSELRKMSKQIQSMIASFDDSTK